MADTFVLGKNAKVYRNSNTYAAPTWVDDINDIIIDVTLGLDKGEWSGPTRGSGGWDMSVGTLRKAEIEIQILHTPGHAGEAALRNSFLNNTMIDLMILDGDRVVAGTEGFRAEMEVFAFPRDEKLLEGITIKAKVKPRISTHAPVWVTI